MLRERKERKKGVTLKVHRNFQQRNESLCFPHVSFLLSLFADTIAVTQNFINGYNIEKCLEELVYDDRIRYFDTLVKRVCAARPEYAELVRAAEIRIREEMEEEVRSKRRSFLWLSVMSNGEQEQEE